MAKTINRLALQQSLVRNGLAEDPAASQVADDWGAEIDAVTADLATKEDLDKAVERIEHRLTEELSGLRSDMDKGLSALRLDIERRDKERAERESEWWRLQQERDDKWRADQQKREDDWRREQQKRDDAREKRDEEWRKEQRERDLEASKAASRILWAIFGVGATLGTIFGIVIAVT